MSYLIHYNKNHSSKNGRFTSGDGDGDGIANDHANRSKKSNPSASGAINLDEEDEDEEPKSKGVTSKYTFKELVRRQNEKNKKKKKSGSRRKKSTKKKKVKQKVVQDIIVGASNKSLSEAENDTNKNTQNIEDLIYSYDSNPISDLRRLLGK